MIVKQDMKWSLFCLSSNGWIIFCLIRILWYFLASQDQHSLRLTGRRMCSHPSRSNEGQKMSYWLLLMKSRYDFVPGWATRRAFLIDWLSLLWKYKKTPFVQETYINKMFPGLHALLPSRHCRCVFWDSWAPTPSLAVGSLEELSSFVSGTLLRVCRFSQPEAVTQFGINKEESISPWISGRAFQDWGSWVLFSVTEMYQTHHASTETFRAQKILLAVENPVGEHLSKSAINSHPGETSLFPLGTSAVLACARIQPGWHRTVSKSRRERSNWGSHGLNLVGNQSGSRAWTCGFPSWSLGGSIYFLLNLILLRVFSRGVGKTVY